VHCVRFSVLVLPQFSIINIDQQTVRKLVKRVSHGPDTLLDRGRAGYFRLAAESFVPEPRNTVSAQLCDKSNQRIILSYVPFTHIRTA
jgi:hypothetical protein